MTTRRAFLASSTGFFAAPRLACAQDTYPSKPIRIIVPFGPGGLADVTARLVAQKLGTLIGQQPVIVNQPGAGGIAAAKAVLAAPADGYILAFFTNGTAISVPLVADLGFDPLTQFVPISGLGAFDFVFAVPAERPWRDLKEVVAAARAKPGALNIGTINIGSSQHLTAALLNATYGLETTIVPFRTSPEVITAARRGDVDLMIDGYVAMRAALDAGQARALATTGTKRTRYLAAVPTVAEALGGAFEVTSWNALFAAAGTPATVVALLNAKLREALGDVELLGKLGDLGIEGFAGPPEVIADRLKADIAKWGEVIRRAGIPKQ